MPDARRLASLAEKQTFIQVAGYVRVRLIADVQRIEYGFGPGPAVALTWKSEVLSRFHTPSLRINFDAPPLNDSGCRDCYSARLLLYDECAPRRNGLQSGRRCSGISNPTTRSPPSINWERGTSSSLARGTRTGLTVSRFE